MTKHYLSSPIYSIVKPQLQQKQSKSNQQISKTADRAPATLFTANETTSPFPAKVQGQFISSGMSSEWVYLGRPFSAQSEFSFRQTGKGPRPTHSGPQVKLALCVQRFDWTSDHCHCQRHKNNEPKKESKGCGERCDESTEDDGQQFIIFSAHTSK